MTDIELAYPADPAEITDFASKIGLVATVFELKSYPGALHWHFRQKQEAGTLEATWWPRKRRFWLSLHANRTAQWQAEAIVKFQHRFPL